MSKYAKTKSGFVPAGALIISLLALLMLGGGIVYQYNENKKEKSTSDTSVDNFQNYHNLQNAGAGKSVNNDHQKINQLPGGDISDEERVGLLLMREEEKLARDVYKTLYDKWQVQIFDNISISEQRHMLAIKSLLDKYEIADPVKNDAVGIFENQTLSELYTDLVAQGFVSLAEAMKVGATIEDLDIRDLQNAIDKTDNEDIKTVYENLMRGSRNHMRAFGRELNRLNVSYEAQYISQQEYDKIVTSQTERGQGVKQSSGVEYGHEQGRGEGRQKQGKGMHNGQGDGVGAGQGRHGHAQ